MKALSTFLLLLSSTDFRIASGAGIRAGSGVKDETPQERSNHGLAEADEHPTAPADTLEHHDPHVESIAREYNLSIEDAEQVRKVQRDFEWLVEDLCDDVNFLQSEFPTELDGPFVLKFKDGKVPEEGRDGIEKFMAKNENAKLEVVHSRLSLEEAEERGDRLLAKLESKGHSQAAYAIDGDDLEVWAAKPKAQRSLGETEGEDDGLMSFSRAAEVLDLDRDHRDLEGLELHLYEHLDEDLANAHQGEDEGVDATESTHARPDARLLADKTKAYGGTRLERLITECTSGFVVQHKRNKKCGILTAGHCDGIRYMEDTWEEDGDNRIRLNPNLNDEEDGTKNPSVDKYGEYWWYSFEPARKVKATNEFYDAHGDRVAVKRAQKSISKGQELCGYSRNKGEKLCAKVKNTSGSSKPDMGIPRFKKVVVMELPDKFDGKPLNDYFFVKGDSGGPWWRKNDGINAVGILGGEWDKCEKKGDGFCVYFSKVRYIEDKLGVEVVTSSDPNCKE